MLGTLRAGYLFFNKIRRTMKMESLTKEDILLKDSLTYKELMKSLKLFGVK